jgi:hypothetical protein
LPYVDPIGSGHFGFVSLGCLAWVVDRGDAVAELGVALGGVEANLVAVRVVQQGQDPTGAGPVDAGVLIAQRGQAFGQLGDGGPVRHPDREVVEAGSGGGTIRVEAQRDTG